MGLAVGTVDVLARSVRHDRLQSRIRHLFGCPQLGTPGLAPAAVDIGGSELKGLPPPADRHELALSHGWMLLTRVPVTAPTVILGLV